MSIIHLERNAVATAGRSKAECATICVLGKAQNMNTVAERPINFSFEVLENILESVESYFDQAGFGRVQSFEPGRPLLLTIRAVGT
jgi:hypothetical protein